MLEMPTLEGRAIIFSDSPDTYQPKPSKCARAVITKGGKVK
jgi:hypothetical protein